MSESSQSTEKIMPQIVGIRFQKIGKPRKALLSAVARRPLADEAISRLAKI
ncbi:MAG: hypothetical protein M1347_00070 [Chloroflexi bacterium]|nr:hypothetical protein [Chloroflexota bacterium]